MNDKQEQELEEKLNVAINLLAEWCVAVQDNGASWDDWDSHFKEACYQPSILREMIDAEMARIRKQNERN